MDTPRVIRPDIILTDDGFIIAELDNVPGGIGLTAWLSGVYAGQGETILGGPEGMLDGFASILPGGDIVVSEEASTYRPEMEWLATRLNSTRSQIGTWRVVEDAPGMTGKRMSIGSSSCSISPTCALRLSSVKRP